MLSGDERVFAVTSTPAPARTQGARTAATRDKLITAAIACICTVGYAETTTTMIAERAGVSRGALQHHFASKSDLIVAVMDVVSEKLMLEFDIPALTRLPLEARLEAVVAFLLDAYGSAAFRATVNIWLAVTDDAELFKRLEKRMSAARTGAPRVWREVFFDVRCSDATLLSLRRIMSAIARGYAVSRIFEPLDPRAEDVRVLCSMLVAVLQGSIAGL